MAQHNRSSGERFVRYPRRFHDALRRADINPRQFLLGCFLAGEVDFETGEVALTLGALGDGLGWEWSEDTLLRDLKALRPAWVDFETKQGQRSPYLFRLTGLAVGIGAELPADFRRETPSGAEVTSELRKSGPPAKSQPERDPARSEPPPSGSPKKRRDETRRESLSEERDPLLGETTAPERDFDDDAFLALVREVGGARNGVHAAAEQARLAFEGRNGTDPVRVEGGDDGSLLWSEPPREGEEGLLADAQALADAGLARWIDEEEVTPA